MLVDLPRY